MVAPIVFYIVRSFYIKTQIIAVFSENCSSYDFYLTVFRSGCAMQYKKTVQLELNERSKALLTRALAKYSLPHLQEMLHTFDCYATASETDYKNIEPWIVWVNAHTGKIT